MNRKNVAGLGVALLATSLFTACTAGTDTASDTENVSPDVDDVQSITIGLLQVGSSAAIQYGIDEDIFEEHGLDVEFELARGGSVMVPAVQTGEYDFAIINPLTVMMSNDVGLDMRVLTGFAYAYPEGDDVHGVVTRTDTGIDSFEDLAGQNIAVNTLKTPGDLSIMEATERDGGDPQDISFSEIAFPEMEAQLDLGNVDAAWLPEPFLTRALASPDNELVGYSAQESVPGMPMLSSFTSAEYAAQNPEVVERFETALTEVLEESTANEDEVRELLPDFMGVPEEATDGMRLEEWSSEMRPDLVDHIGELAVKYEFIDEMPENLYLEQ